MAWACYYGTINGTCSCTECDKAYSAHYSHQKLVTVSLFYTKALYVPSFALTQRKSSIFLFIFIIDVFFFIDIMSHLRNITAMWMSVTIAHHTVNATLSYYQVQVSEFAKELLMAQEYYKHDPNFWVHSGLVKHKKIEDAVFKATQVTSSNFNRLSTSETTQQLYKAHSDLLSLLSPALAKAGFNRHLPEVLRWWYMHAVSEALQSPLCSTSPEVIVKQKKITGSKGKGKSKAQG